LVFFLFLGRELFRAPSYCWVWPERFLYGLYECHIFCTHNKTFHTSAQCHFQLQRNHQHDNEIYFPETNFVYFYRIIILGCTYIETKKNGIKSSYNFVSRWYSNYEV